ncbi:uncharacterized protein SCHCODRAFT_02469702, partial [Schizophyllum commune H4-8]|uniref:uncharacterized protein n=1 Tax=Schizophyllum commune (strain H4-8 / FGSC 9210) TaxID=578458 RepID=UPI00215EB01D
SVNAAELAPIYKSQWNALLLTGKVAADAKQSGNWRELVARKELQKLSAEEQKYWKNAAKEFNDARTAEYKRVLTEPPSQTPEARQAAINALPKFIAPLLAGVYARTGMHVCLLLGGPMPKWGGQLKTVCIAAGRNHQGAAKPWPEWPGFNAVTDHFKEYLASAFSEAERQAMSLVFPELTGLEDDGEMPVLSVDGLLTIDPEEDSDEGEITEDEEEREEREKSKKKKKSASKKKSKAVVPEDKDDAPTPKTKATKTKKTKKTPAKQPSVSGSDDAAESNDDDVPTPKTKAKRTPAKTPARPPLPASFCPQPLAGCHIDTGVPQQGAFDVTRPSLTFSQKDPPNANEGQRRLLWMREKYRLSLRAEMPSQQRRLMKEWEADHYVSLDGFVLKRSQAPLPGSATGSPTASASSQPPAPPNTPQPDPRA